MKIKSITIRNFKCLGPEEISFSWDDIIVCVGENNVGKSSILQAVSIFFDNKRNIPAKYFRNFQESYRDVSPIEITVYFSELTDDDKKLVGVKNRLTENGNWVLRKIFKYKKGDKSESVKYYTLTRKKMFENIGKTQNWEKILEVFPESEIAKGKDKTKPIKDDYDDVVDEAFEKKPSLVTVSDKDDWQDNPGGWLSNIEAIFKNNFRHIFIRAVHDVQEECGDNKNSTFLKLIELFISEDLNKRKEMENLKESLNKVATLFKKDATGNYPIRKIGELEGELTKRLSRIILAKTQISVNQLDEGSVLDQILPSAILQVNDNCLTDVDDQGHGLQRALILALLEVLAESETKNISSVGPANVILIEEPELYMHPQMERKMRDVLYAVAASKKFQVICTTHSPVFLNMAEKQESIVIVEKDTQRKVNIKQVEKSIFSGEEFKDEKAKLRMILSFDPTVNELFFAKRVVLVEGDSEIAVFPKAAELLGVDGRVIKDTTLVNCRGKKTMPAFMHVLNHFRLKFLVVHDRDSESDSFNNTIQEIADKEQLGEVKLIIEKLEDIIGLDDVKKDKPIVALQKIEDLSSKGELEGAIKQYVDFIYPNNW